MSTQPGVPGSNLSLLKTILVKVNKWRKEPKYEMSWLMDVYLWSNPVEQGQNDNCHLRFRVKLQDGKITSERCQHHCYLNTDIGRYISNVC